MKHENEFGVFPFIEEYLGDLWWNMHNTDDPNRQAWAFNVRCYLDESGTHDESPYTVVAGLLLNRHNFISLSVEWNKLLYDMRIKPPIHMKEFCRPHGKLAYLTDNERYFLFAKIASIVNYYKIYSVSASLSQEKYRNICKFNKRKEMSPYGMCFICCIDINHRQAEKAKYNYDIAYLLDEGGDNVGHILSGYRVAKYFQKNNRSYHMGSLSFDSDDNIPALQAADVISWGVLRRLKDKTFNDGFDFIENIINNNHFQFSFEDNDLQGIAQRLMKYKDQNH